MKASIVLILLAAAIVRLVLFSMGLNEIFGRRVEIVTPVTSLKRVEEGLYLHQIGLSPYSGTVFHQSPLLLLLLSFFLAPSLPPIFLRLLYVGVDLLIGIILSGIAKAYVNDSTLVVAVVASGSKSSEARGREEPSWFEKHPHAIAALYPLIFNFIEEFDESRYLFNPFAVASCVGMSTIIFTNFAIVACAYFSLRGKVPMATFSLAVASYLSFNPLVLLVPVCIVLKKHATKKIPFTHLFTVLFFTLFSGVLLLLSFLLMGSWEFLRETYGFVWLVEDATPNIGLFWYYFVEIFIYFKSFFLFAFQFHPFVYIVPLTYRLSHHPFFLFWTLLAISTTFKAYPALGDFTVYIAMLPLFHKIVHQMTYLFFPLCKARYPIVVGVVMLVVSVLAPVIWHMWLYTGGGNANFYYAVTLVFTLAQVLLISDAAGSVVKKDYLLKHNIALPGQQQN